MHRSLEMRYRKPLRLPIALRLIPYRFNHRWSSLSVTARKCGSHATEKLNKRVSFLFEVRSWKEQNSFNKIQQNLNIFVSSINILTLNGLWQSVYTFRKHFLHRIIFKVLRKIRTIKWQSIKFRMIKISIIHTRVLIYSNVTRDYFYLCLSSLKNVTPSMKILARKILRDQFDRDMQ